MMNTLLKRLGQMADHDLYSLSEAIDSSFNDARI
jgi:hypothetical protein